MKNYFFLLALVLTIGCSTNQKNKLLVGSWYYFDSDSNYVELYFSNELVSVNSEWTSAGRLFYYQVYNDKVFRSFDNFKKDKKFIFKIVDSREDTLLIEFERSGSETIKLIKFNFGGDVFTKLCLPMEKEMELIEGRLAREALILGYDTGFYEDEILELP